MKLDPVLALAGFMIAGVLAVGVLVDTLLANGEPPVEDLDEYVLCSTREVPQWYAREHRCVNIDGGVP